MEFKDLGIHKNILEALNSAGYTNPTPIQAQAIPAVLACKDVLGLAQTGTGKTAAFAVPTLQRLSEQSLKGKRPIRALVLTPTRELAIQIQESFVTYGRHLGMKSTVIFGGVSQGAQVKALRAGVDILVATPGRLDDLIKQKYVELSSVEVFILDEADRMLDMGFINDIRKIIKKLPKKKQTLLFSATMPPEISDIANQLLHNPVKVEVTPVSSTVERVRQEVYYVDKGNKLNLLEDIVKEKRGQSILVFSRTKHGADKIVKELVRRNVKAQAIHGNKSQNARQQALHNFKNEMTQVLVATDIAARGIDIDELECVVNFDLTDVPETYVHRIGRTGRAGKEGTAISFTTFEDIVLLKDIERLTKQKLIVMENDKYPLVDKTISKSKMSKKQKAKRAALGIEGVLASSKASKRPMARKKKRVLKDASANLQEAHGEGRQNSRKNTKKKEEKPLNGPYDWSNHKPKKQKSKTKSSVKTHTKSHKKSK